MSLEPGRKLGPYEIVSLLGAGGMGEVYRARDTRLDRTVAIKVLSTGIASTSAARARFEREAKAIAALSHPHICAIHDVGSDGGTEYLVMEYLEGETLASRLARGPLALDQLLRCGVEIASALHQAHRSGLAHRDLKPGNILLTATGAKLLDFGLAKAVERSSVSSAESTTMNQAAPLTAEGTVVGTIHYMSPEQVEGKDVDHRTDIFSFGVILYEMATGQRPFIGTSAASVLASILEREPPPVRALQPQMPAALERIITTSLEKNPDQRWQSAQDVGRQLRWLQEASSPEQLAAPPRKRRAHLFLVLPLVAVAASILTWIGMRSFSRTSPSRGIVRLQLASPPGVSFARPGDINAFAISPDGSALAFVGFSGGERAIFVRDLDTDEARRIQGSEAGNGPFWSPDGLWLGFSARGKLWKTTSAGTSPPEALADVSLWGAIGAWSGRTILFSDAPDGRTSVFRVADTGGAAEAVTHPGRDEWRHTWPHVLPDGRHFLYLAYHADSLDREVVLATLDGRKIGVLGKNTSQVRTVGDDQLVYVREGRLLAQRYDRSGVKLIGDPRPVASDVANFHPTARADFDASPSGVIAYRTNTSTGRLSLVDRSGAQRRLLDEEGLFFGGNLSPDGKRAAVAVVERTTGLGDIWLYDLARGIRDRFTSDRGMEWAPVWSPDGRSIVYSETQGGAVPYVVRRTLDGSDHSRLTERGPFRYPVSFSPDGQTLFVVDRGARKGNDILRLSMNDQKVELVIGSDFQDSEPNVSPDGTWLAFSSDVTGPSEVYLQRLDDNSRRIRVSSAGGRAPRWSSDARELFYLGRDGRTVYSVRSESSGWEDAKAVSLFTSPIDLNSFLVMPDGQSFVLLQEAPGAYDDLLNVILGWE